MGEWRYSFTILDLSAIWRKVVTFTGRPLHRQGVYSTDCAGEGGPQTQSGRCEGEKTLLPLLGIEPWQSSQ
jgi:hypothetical protein